MYNIDINLSKNQSERKSRSNSFTSTLGNYYLQKITTSSEAQTVLNLHLELFIYYSSLHVKKLYLFPTMATMIVMALEAYLKM